VRHLRYYIVVAGVSSQSNQITISAQSKACVKHIFFRPVRACDLFLDDLIFICVCVYRYEYVCLYILVFVFIYVYVYVYVYIYVHVQCDHT